MKRTKIPWLSRVSYLYQHTISGVATFTGMGGNLPPEWVATLDRNGWQPWTGILLQAVRHPSLLKIEFEELSYS
jgi:hypothetical protein